MQKRTIIQLGVLVVAVGAAVALVLSLNAPKAAPRSVTLPDGTPAPTLAADTHLLDDAGPGAVTFVEFLDFECEICAQVAPVVSELREEYSGSVTFAVRYFPLPGHINSRNAALAAEAAAQQGKFEEMYDTLFATVGEWGEQGVSTPAVFRVLADEIGLDLAAYDAAIADPATEARVQADFDAAVLLGAQGTPTIFVDDRMIELTSPDGLRAELDAALKKKQ